MWKIDFTEKAKRNFKKLDFAIQKRILLYLDNIRLKNPKDFGAGLVGDKRGLWRYRVGDYRIIAEIKQKEIIVLIVDIGHRREVYDKQ
jgi:mRNA interferase RelE/StbE